MAVPREDLPEEVDALRAALLAERARAARVEAELAVARAKASDDEALIAHQRLQIEKLTRQLYGPRSERTVRLVDQMELAFEELESSASEDEIAAERAVAKTTNVVAFTRKRPARQPFPDHLPRERVVELGPTTCLCCGSPRLRKLGEDVTETLEVTPRQWKVIQHVREKFTCCDCEKISQAPTPFHVIPRGWAGPSLLAMILFEKYGQHQPLNRQADRYAREGVPLSLSTLADQVGRALPCWHRCCGESKRTSSRPNDCTVTTRPCRCSPRERRLPVAYGRMYAMTGRLPARTHRRRCSTIRVIAGANIRPGIWPVMPGSSRPMPMAATTSCTRPIASRDRSSRRPAGRMLAGRSSSWPISRQMPDARRKANRPA